MALRSEVAIPMPATTRAPGRPTSLEGLVFPKRARFIQTLAGSNTGDRLSGGVRTGRRPAPGWRGPDHRGTASSDQVRQRARAHYEVILPRGEATLPHEHRFDSFSILFRTTEILNEPFGTEPAAVAVTGGDVLFASTADGPYSHRVSAAGQATFHVIAMEVLTPAPAGPAAPAQHLRPPFAILRESSRGRAYRVRLEAGEASEAFTRAANSALFAISSGRVSEHGGGMPARLWDFEPGHFRWFDASERLVLKNESPAPIHLVAVEVF